MSDEVLLAGKAGGAVRARERPLPSVCAVVSGQKVRPLKDMTTHLTRVQFATTAVG